MTINAVIIIASTSASENETPTSPGLETAMHIAMTTISWEDDWNTNPSRALQGTEWMVRRRDDQVWESRHCGASIAPHNPFVALVEPWDPEGDFARPCRGCGLFV